MEGFERIRIKRVLPPMGHGTAVHLGHDEKTFVMYIGLAEGAALLRELKDEEAVRPMTHDLLGSILTGYDLDVKRVLISDIVENTFTATLVLTEAGDGAEDGLHEVRIDARPSDCLVLSLKQDVPIWCHETVLERVRDVTGETSGLSPEILAQLGQSGWEEGGGAEPDGPELDLPEGSGPSEASGPEEDDGEEPDDAADG